jgi:hypothetical protein
MKNFTTLFTLLAILLAFSLNAQVAINNDGSSAFGGSSTILDVKDDNGIHSLFIEADGNIGIRNTSPSWMFNMTNGGTPVGDNAVMAEFENAGEAGVSLSAWNNSNNNGYNAFEGIIDYVGNSFLPSGVYGLALDNTTTTSAIGVRGHINSVYGYGVQGSRAASNNYVGFGGLFYNDLGYTGGLYSMSDSKLKKNINHIDNALDIIVNTNVYSYDWKLDEYPNLGIHEGEHYGFIAQEIKELVPSAVALKRVDANSCMIIDKNNVSNPKMIEVQMVDYTTYIPILTQAIKDQQEIIENLERRIAELESKINNQ